MRIFIAGASGLIGVRLVPLLVSAGHVVAGPPSPPRIVISLAAWLILVAYAASHPQWKHQQPASGPRHARPGRGRG